MTYGQLFSDYHLHQWFFEISLIIFLLHFQQAGIEPKINFSRKHSIAIY